MPGRTPPDGVVKPEAAVSSAPPGDAASPVASLVLSHHVTVRSPKVKWSRST